MEKIHEMVAAMCTAATAYGAEHDLNLNEVMNALAHTYVIFGFTVKKDDVTPQLMKAALVDCVSESCDHMMGVIADAEEA